MINHRERIVESFFWMYLSCYQSSYLYWSRGISYDDAQGNYFFSFCIKTLLLLLGFLFLNCQSLYTKDVMGFIEQIPEQMDIHYISILILILAITQPDQDKLKQIDQRSIQTNIKIQQQNQQQQHLISNTKLNFYLKRMQHKYNTPQRRYVLESQPVNRRYNVTTGYKNDSSSVIDYKSKTFQLMQTISQLQIRDKQNHRNVFYLQRQLEMIQRELAEFLGMMGAESLEEVRVKFQKMSEKVAQMMEDRDKPLLKEERVTVEYEKILKEYKTIIGNQEDKMVKYQQKWKASQVLLKEQLQQTKAQLILRTTSVSQLKDTLEKIKEDGRKQTERVRAQMKDVIQEQRQAAVREKQAMAREKQRMMKERQQREQKCKTLEESLRLIKEEKGKAIQTNKQMVQVNTQMKQDLDLIKSEFRELIIQKQSIQDKHQKLKKKYKQEIQHFQMIQKQVQEKLIQVQREITFYKEESQQQQDQIQKLKKELAEKHSMFQEEFSFGDWCSTYTQTDEGMGNIADGMVMGGKRQMDNRKDQGESKDDRTQQQQIALNAQCYEISIRSLLEQNSRLKRTLMLLDKSKRGQTLPPQAQLQLRLLKGLSQLPSNRQIQPSISIIAPKKQQEVSLQLQKMHEMQIDSPTFSKSAYNGTPDIDQAKTEREQVQQQQKQVSDFKSE